MIRIVCENEDVTKALKTDPKLGSWIATSQRVIGLPRPVTLYSMLLMAP